MTVSSTARSRIAHVRHSSKTEILARLGYAAKGVVYATIGLLTLSSVFGWFSESSRGATGSREAVHVIASQPFGNLLLVLLVIGLAGYVFWRFVQAIKDTEGKGKDAKGIVLRLAYAISGLVYASLAVYTVSLTGWLSSGSGVGAGPSKNAMLAELLSQSWGPWLVGSVGIVLIFVGCAQLHIAISKKFLQDWKTGQLVGAKRRIAERFARVGIGARGVTFWILGGLVIQAALQSNPEKAKGLGEALDALRDERFGDLLLAVVSAGLFCYGLYCFLNARYRRIRD